MSVSLRQTEQTGQESAFHLFYQKFHSNLSFWTDLYFGRVCGEKHNKLGGLDGVPKKLDIVRVIVISDNTTKESTIWSRWGLDKPITKVNADVDIYLQDGTCIQVNSSNEKLLKKLMKFVWEVNADPRVKFYRKMQRVELNRETWNRTQL